MIIYNDNNIHKKKVSVLEKYLIGIIITLLLIPVFLFINELLFVPTPSEHISEHIDTSQYPKLIPYSQELPIFIQGKKRNYFVYPQAEYTITARVLGKKLHYLDSHAEISPVDLALGWGELSDIKYDKYFNSHFFLRGFQPGVKSDMPLSQSDVYKHISNNHLIPSNSNIEKALKRVKKNDLVVIEGYLVNVYSTNYYFETSLVIGGDYLCEVMYVNRIRINDKIYE